MTVLAKQKGMTFFSLMIVLIVAGVFFSVGFKLYPAYWDNHLVKSVLTDLVAEDATRDDSVHEIRSKIQKRLRINQVKLPSQEAITFNTDEGVRTITLAYEVQVPMFYNVDALVKFNDQYKVILR